MYLAHNPQPWGPTSNVLGTQPTAFGVLQAQCTWHTTHSLGVLQAQCTWHTTHSLWGPTSILPKIDLTRYEWSIFGNQIDCHVLSLLSPHVNCLMNFFELNTTTTFKMYLILYAHFYTTTSIFFIVAPFKQRVVISESELGYWPSRTGTHPLLQFLCSVNDGL